MQNITVIGRLGRDVVLKETTSGSQFIAGTVAANARRNGAEKTTWYDFTTFNVDRYKNMMAWLKKGSSVVIVGELDASVSEGSDGKERLRLNITADRIDFGSSGNSGSTSTDTTATVEVAQETVDEKPKATKTKVSKKEEPKTVEVSTEDDSDLPF